MKNIAFKILSMSLLTVMFPNPVHAGDLVVSLTGIQNARGHIRIALYDDQGRWKNDVEARKTLKSCLCVLDSAKTGKGEATVKFKGKAGANPILVPAKDAQNGKFTLTITGLKPGKYAVSLFHDQNDNRVMDMKPLLLVAESPAEPFGLSRNFNPLRSLRAPKFEDCAFAVGDGQIRQEIVLR